MKEEYKDFVGIFDESVPVKLCNDFVNSYEVAKQNQTVIDLTKESARNQTGMVEQNPANTRKDESIVVAPLYSTIYPKPPVMAYFDFLKQCYIKYMKHYGIEFNGPMYNNIFKIHKVKKSEGFHLWHYEKNNPLSVDRMIVYMTYLEVPKKGGETEFLHQSLRIDPIVGRTLIWPAGFTHMHRGNPPLEGEKMYITGWFTCGMEDLNEPYNNEWLMKRSLK